MKLRHLVLVSLLVLSAGCTPGQREAARSALEVAKTVCIIAKQALSNDEVARVCGITGPLIGPMQDVLMEARAASAQAVAGAHVGACGPTTGGKP